ncbi:hypothetical protein BC938DRAFT_484183 [Jimgerdemannia flammicorona]|uniref:Uncharacterized protein n=1 Tax=Jimgerdemannia flammicorona TaxID=994334 RepID=A0A433R045_9FUNG|nr:hypothetical protein BC938DRAFT_484183 [Jimgerdemannia flammicorona]
MTFSTLTTLLETITGVLIILVIQALVMVLRTNFKFVSITCGPQPDAPSYSPTRALSSDDSDTLRNSAVDFDTSRAEAFRSSLQDSFHNRKLRDDAVRFDAAFRSFRTGPRLRHTSFDAAFRTRAGPLLRHTSHDTNVVRADAIHLDASFRSFKAGPPPRETNNVRANAGRASNVIQDYAFCNSGIGQSHEFFSSVLIPFKPYILPGARGLPPPQPLPYLPSPPCYENGLPAAGNFIPILTPLPISMLDDLMAGIQQCGDPMEGVEPAPVEYYDPMEGVEYPSNTMEGIEFEPWPAKRKWGYYISLRWPYHGALIKAHSTITPSTATPSTIQGQPVAATTRSPAGTCSNTMRSITTPFIVTTPSTGTRYTTQARPVAATISRLSRRAHQGALHHNALHRDALHYSRPARGCNNEEPRGHALQHDALHNDTLHCDDALHRDTLHHSSPARGGYYIALRWPYHDALIKAHSTLTPSTATPSTIQGQPVAATTRSPVGTRSNTMRSITTPFIVAATTSRPAGPITTRAPPRRAPPRGAPPERAPPQRAPLRRPPSQPPPTRRAPPLMGVPRPQQRRAPEAVIQRTPLALSRLASSRRAPQQRAPPRSLQLQRFTSQGRPGAAATTRSTTTHSTTTRSTTPCSTTPCSTTTRSTTTPSIPTLQLDTLPHSRLFRVRNNVAPRRPYYIVPHWHYHDALHHDAFHHDVFHCTSQGCPVAAAPSRPAYRDALHHDALHHHALLCDALQHSRLATTTSFYHDALLHHALPCHALHHSRRGCNNVGESTSSERQVAAAISPVSTSLSITTLTSKQCLNANANFNANVNINANDSINAKCASENPPIQVMTQRKAVENARRVRQDNLNVQWRKCVTKTYERLHKCLACTREVTGCLF